MTAPLDVQGSATQAEPEAVLAGAPKGAIQGRSLSAIAWMRLKRDRVAIGAFGFLVFIVLVAILAKPITELLGHPPNVQYTQFLNQSTTLPNGPFGGVSRHFLLGIEPVVGRDLFSRVVFGAQISLLVSVLATVLAMIIGVVLGAIAGYFGGLTDTLISRTMDLMLAFPYLLFAIALLVIINNVNGSFAGLSGFWLHIVAIIIVIGMFSWAYIGRIIRGQTLSLREKEFIEAARSLGAGPTHILFRQLLPNLWAPILVYSTLLIPTNILTEAALSFLGVGVPPPTASWGGMISSAVSYYQVDPMYMVVPGVAIFLTVLAFNLFGDGLRDALDPRANR